MKWITREHVRVDRVACPWLIRKFVDQAAEFHFVAPEQVMSESQRLGATPFDIPAVELGHLGGSHSGRRAATLAAQRFRLGLDRTEAGDVLEDQEEPPHGDRCCRGEPNRRA